jgi:hypothetical protein
MILRDWFKHYVMKKILLTFFAVLVLVVAVQAQTVYITRTGTKYHRSDCRYLHSSKISTTLADAKLNYTACSVCKPPTEVEDEEEGDVEVAEAGSSGTPAAERAPAKPKPASTVVSKSRQCSGYTKSGARCKRMTTSGNGRCYQH